MKEQIVINYRRIFGAGPTGLVVTVGIWVAALQLEAFLGIPKIGIGPAFRWILFIFFAVDAVTTIVWSFFVLPPHQRGKKLVTTGPYQFVRHPLYSAIIWSGTGMVAVWFRSWFVIASALPISIFWSWHVQKEELYMIKKFGDEYREYMKNTGQFFPSLGKQQDIRK